MAGCCVCVRDDYQVWSCALLRVWPGVRWACRPTAKPATDAGRGAAQWAASIPNCGLI